MPHADDGQLHAYLDGEPAEAGGDTVALERHFAECPACAARLDAVRALRERGRAFLAGGGPLSVEQPPFEEVIARARRPAPTPRRAPRYLVRGAWAASLLAALGAGWLARGLLRDGGGERVAVVEAPARASDASQPEAITMSAPAPAPRNGAAPRASTPAPTRDAAPAPPPATVGAATDGTEVRDEPVEIALEEAAAVGYATARRREVSAAVQAAPPSLAPAQSALPDPPAWTAIDRAEATRVLSRAPLTLPGAALLGMESGLVDGRATVRVRQALEGGGVLTLLQQPAQAELRAESAAPGATADAGGAVTALRGTLLVTARAPLPADSLRALVERLR